MVREVTKHPGEALVKFLRLGAVGFSGVAAAFQKVGFSDSASHRCNQFHLEPVRLGGVVTMANLVDVHLKDIERREVWVFKQVV